MEKETRKGTASKNEIDALFDKIESLTTHATFTQVRQRTENLTSVLDSFESPRNAHAPETQKTLVRQAQDVMRARMREPLTISQIAATCNVSPTSLKNAFKTVENTPVHQWYRAYRIQQACELLAATKLPITQIAVGVGYTNPSKFSQAFRDATGQTPREWRKTH